MKSFTLHHPTSLAEVFALLPADGAADVQDQVQLLAGGQDLLPELKDHLREADDVVNLKRVPGLDAIEERAGGGLAIGALVTLHDLVRHALVRERFAVLALAAESVGSPQIRSVGTVGGNLCQRPRCWYYRNEGTVCLKKGGNECFAYLGQSRYNAILGGGPSYIVHPSDLAPALVALDATVQIAGPDGTRSVPAERFWILPSEGDVRRETSLAPREVVTGVTIPAPPAGATSTYVKFRERGSYDWALASVALVLVRDGRTIRRARVALGGVAPIPWRASEAEERLEGSEGGLELARAAGDAALAAAQPLEHNAYKVPLTKGLLVKALRALGAA